MLPKIELFLLGVTSAAVMSAHPRNMDKGVALMFPMYQSVMGCGRDAKPWRGKNG